MFDIVPEILNEFQLKIDKYGFFDNYFNTVDIKSKDIVILYNAKVKWFFLFLHN